MKTKVLTFLLCTLSFQISNAQWVQTSNGLGDVIIYSLANNGSKLFAGTISNGLFISTNSGTDWTPSSLSEICYSLAVNGNNIYAGTLNHGVFLSTNSGVTWNQTSLNDRTVRAFAISGNNIFAGTSSGAKGVLLSTDNGTSWTQTALTNKIIYSLTINGSSIFAGATDTGVYMSTNNGTSWTQTSLRNRAIYSIANIGNNIFAGTSGNGIYFSDDNGTTWSQTSLGYSNGFSLAVYGNNVYAGMGFASGFHVSSDNGLSWSQRNEGLENLYIYASSILNNNIFIGTAGKSVYKRPLSQLTGIQQISTETADKFSLTQNYPNPFNPVTHLGFGIPELGFVTLKVYSALGKEVQTLVNENLSPGTYNVEFNGSDLPSGVYFYELRSGKLMEVKKMYLIK